SPLDAVATDLQNGLPIVRVNRFDPWIHDRFGGIEVEIVEQATIVIGMVSFAIGHGDHAGNALEDQRELALTLAQRLLRFALVVDVESESVPTCDATLGIAGRSSHGAEPAILAVAAAQPMLGFIGLSRRKALAPMLDHTVLFVRVEHDGAREDRLLVSFALDAGVFEDAGIEVTEVSLRVGGPSQAGHAVDDQAGFMLLPP